jgi:VWFA-related protein
VPLAVFSSDSQPITAAVMVDMSGAMFDRLTFAYLREGLSGLIDRFEPADRARVGWFSTTEAHPGRGLTSDKAALKQMVANEIRIEQAVPDAMYNAVLTLRPVGRPLWNAIAMAMQSLASQPGRKVILVLTNGANTASLDGLPGLEDINAALPRDEFMIYVVHGFQLRRANGFRPQSVDDAIAHEAAQRKLRDLAEQTGGGFIAAPFDTRKKSVGQRIDDDRHPLSHAFVSQLTGIVDELRQQYTLGFVPSRRDGKVAKIDVRATRHDLNVWARKTYVAPPP